MDLSAAELFAVTVSLTVFTTSGAGHEHVARVAHHEDEVGHGRRIDVAARARTHDDAKSADDARGQNVALEDLAIAAERATPSWMRAPPASNRPMIGARFFSAILDLVIFCAWVSDEPPEHGEVLGEDVDDAAVDRAPSRDDAVAGIFSPWSMPKIRAAVLTNMSNSNDRGRAKFPMRSRPSARGRAGLDALLAAAEAGRLAALRGLRQCGFIAGVPGLTKPSRADSTPAAPLAASGSTNSSEETDAPAQPGRIDNSARRGGPGPGNQADGPDRSAAKKDVIDRRGRTSPGRLDQPAC